MRQLNYNSKVGVLNAIKVNKLANKLIHTNIMSLYRRILRLASYILLFDMAFIFLYPFFYMIVTSLKTNADLYDITINWIPSKIKYQNYIMAYRALSYFKYFKNSAIYTIMGTIGHLLGCSFIGYGFARYKYPGKNFLFAIVLLSIIIPVQTLIVPLYMTYANFKWLNTYLPVIVPTFFGFGLRGGLFTFIFRQFYLGLPKALEDAARIDGCGFLRTYWNIALPIVQSAFLVAIVLSTVWHWNDFYEPGIYAGNPALTPLPVMVTKLIVLVHNPPLSLFEGMNLMESEAVMNTAVLMAGTFLVILPVLIVFAFLQRGFMQGIERTGLVE